MSALDFDFEWLDPGGARGEELRATWARLEIKVNGQAITRVYDRSSRSVRDSVYAPLYPLAEWVVFHWWQLIYEVESPGRLDESEYSSRHDLRFAREGYAYPSIIIEPAVKEVKIAWSPESLDYSGVDFLEQGHRFVPTEDLRSSLSNFINSVIGRLEQEGIEDSPLQESWRAILEADDDEAAFCMASGSLGWDPYSISDSQADDLIQAIQRLPDSIIQEFLAAATPSQLSTQSKTVEQDLIRLEDSESELRSLQQLNASYKQLSPHRSPWKQGYELANWARENLSDPQLPIRSDNDLSRVLDMETESGSSSILVGDDHETPIDALVKETANGSPGMVVYHSRPEAYRFALCRGIFEYITNPLEPGIVTRSRSFQQKRNRAFAAEFILPSKVLSRKIKGNTIGTEDMDELAHEFGVDKSIVMHQVINHHLARVVHNF